MNDLRTQLARSRRLALAVALMLAAGCSAAVGGGDPSSGVLEFQQMVWPEPPLDPRIRFLTSLSDEKGMGREPTFGENLNTFLTGRPMRELRVMQPMDIEVSDDGKRVYVSDFTLRRIFVFDLDAQSMKTVGGDDRQWAYPFGLALDGEERLYVVEQETRTISVVDREGKVVNSFTDPSLERPTDIEVDRERGLIYVVDGSHQKSAAHFVKVFDSGGQFLRDIGGGKGSGDGDLMFPTYLTVAPSGDIYVTDTVNSRVSVFGPDGEFRHKIGRRGDRFGMFDKPKGVALDSFGNIYVVDSGWSNVQIFNQRGEVLLFFGGRGAFPGLMRNPTGIAIDAQNKIYVGDYLNNRIDVYELVNTSAEDSYGESLSVVADEAALAVGQ